MPGKPLKRTCRFLPATDALVVAVLKHRGQRWRANLVARVEPGLDPDARVLAVFDWLGQWFANPGFRGCAWGNAHGELRPSSEAVLAEVRSHKQAFHDQIAVWAHAAGVPVAEQVFLLAEGVLATAGIMGDPEPARHARADVAAMLDAPRSLATSSTTPCGGAVPAVREGLRSLRPRKKLSRFEMPGPGGCAPEVADECDRRDRPGSRRRRLAGAGECLVSPALEPGRSAVAIPW